MKRILMLFCFLLCFVGCNNMTNEEKVILDKYVELTSEDYINQYDYLIDNVKIVSVDYQTVMNKMKKDSFILYVGGAWCPNCQAVAKFINDAAIETNQIVYNFDTRIGVEKTMESDIRNCFDKASYNLYKKFIEASSYVNPNQTVTENTDVYRMSVPTILVYQDGKLLDFISEEYFYDGTILFKKEEFHLENKTDYSEEFYNSLLKLFAAI